MASCNSAPELQTKRVDLSNEPARPMFRHSLLVLTV